jgi:hypothetical protein
MPQAVEPIHGIDIDAVGTDTIRITVVLPRLYFSA